VLLKDETPHLSPDLLDLVARRLRVIAEPTRMRILALLERGEASVQELTDELPTTHQNVSKHLAALLQAGIVSRRREGSWVRYSLADYTAYRLIEHAAAGFAGHIDELAEITHPHA
jgi:DNA-binding transcriptional ArsR family regulator